MTGNEQTLSIGAVSKLTGIPTDTIRTWERRYNVVEPSRTASGRRVYGPRDVERLRIVAQLVDNGDRVADLAALDSDELEQRLRLHEPVSGGMPSVVRVAVAHPTASGALDGALSSEGLQLQVVSDITATGDVGAVDADVLVVDFDRIDGNVATLRQWMTSSQARATVVTAGHLSRPIRKQLSAMPLRLLTRPVRAPQLKQAVVDSLRWSFDVGVQEAEPVREPQFSRTQLEHLMNLHPDLLCECPNHIAALVIAMREFEVYSQDCVSNTQEDAALHGELAQETGMMRAELERLLVKVCDHDGIDLNSVFPQN